MDGMQGVDLYGGEPAPVRLLLLPVVFGMVGPAAIPPIVEFVLDQAHSTRAVATALSGLGAIAARHPECQACIDTVVRRLEFQPNADAAINSLAVPALLNP